jgi:hypothetical protein
MDHPEVRDMVEQTNVPARRTNGAEFRAPVNPAPVVIPTGVYTIVVFCRAWD